MLYGIDVSGAQEGIDIVKLKQLNPDLAFVGVKSTGSGGAYVNPDCDRVMQQCFSIGLPCFNYDFTEDGVPAPQPPSAYAEGIAAHITGYAGKAGVAIDWESTIASGLMGNADYAAAAVARLQQLRISPGFYIDYRTLTNGADWSKVAATGVWKWRASYVYDRQDGQTPFYGFGNPDWSLMAPTPAWPDPPAIWQYTSCGYLQGWTGKLDFNVFNGDEDGLRRLLGIDAQPSINPAGNVTPEDDMALTDQDKDDIAFKTAKQILDFKIAREGDHNTLGGDSSLAGVIANIDSLFNGANAHVDEAVKGIALTPTDAQIQAFADKLNASLPAGVLAALKAKL